MIETLRLKLRPVNMEDAEDIFEYAQDEDTGPRAGWPPHKTIDTTKKVINMWLDPNHTEEVFAIIEKKDSKIIGTIGITDLNKNLKDNLNTFAIDLIKRGKSVCEIGFTLSKAYWGKGFGTEALSGMLGYLFENRNVDVAMATHYDANIASMKVQEKNNMKVLGSYERDKSWYNTDCKTMIVRAITKNEWQMMK